MKEYSTYEDLIFRGKPKEYGAYKLRKQYSLRLMISVVMGLSLVSAVYLYPILSREKEVEVNPQRLKIKSKSTINYSQLSAPPPVQLEQIEAPPVAITDIPQIKTVKFLPPVIKPDAEIESEEILPTQNELKKANIGKENIEGVDSVVNYFIPQNVEIELPPEQEQVVEVVSPPSAPPAKKEEMPIFDWSTQSPEFPGGVAALNRFFDENITYPPDAREVQMEARIVVQFVVEKDGSLTNIRIIRSGGPLFDAEVMRVMGLMPNWIPGENNGNTVRVKSVVPVNFELEDQ